MNYIIIVPDLVSRITKAFNFFYFTRKTHTYRYDTPN